MKDLELSDIIFYIIVFLVIFLSLPVLTIIFFFYFLCMVIRELVNKKNVFSSLYIWGLMITFFPIYLFFFPLVGFGFNNFDGKYCTEVSIKNSKKDYNTYDLTVEVSKNRLTKIYFPKGGWLDKDNFSRRKVIIKQDGYCSFKDDRGRKISFYLSEYDEGTCN